MGFFDKIKSIILGKSKIDDSFLEELEEALLLADIGFETTTFLLSVLEKEAAKSKIYQADDLINLLKTEIKKIVTVTSQDISIESPQVIMVVGVNGVGKTTSIAKLATYYKNQNLSVILGAADTFRAAAPEQLAHWSTKIGVQIVSQHLGADPASVAFDTVQSAHAKKIDVAIIDTAGRLHNKVNLMQELTKIDAVVKKANYNKQHQALLVLDGSTGQNAIEQCRQFSKALKINGIIVTKLDGSAKGGVIIGICNEFKIPVKYIGVGEQASQLEVFNPTTFVNSLF